MNLKRKSFAVSLMMVLTGHLMAQNPLLDPKLQQAMGLVSAEEIKKDITFLSDDALLGRAPGSVGFKTAADYCISRLKESGVSPAGENSGWMQKVRFRRAFLKNSIFQIRNSEGKNLDTGQADYLIYPNPSLENVSISSPIVFAGFGVSEPKLGYDDYNNINVKGKTVVVLRGAPENFSSSAAAHVTNISTILKSAAEHGAIGVLVASADTSVKNLPDLSKGVISVLNEKGKVVLSKSYDSDKLKFYGLVKATLLNNWLLTAGKSMAALAADLKAGKANSFAIPGEIAATYQSYYRDFLSYNVIGKITGSDPLLKKQFVVHSAHLDHLGVAKAIEADSIYNGAHDNASGVTSVLAISKMYAGLSEKPKRSILFVLLTGEELGLLGSGYFAKYPTVASENIVADVNTDMPTIIAPLLSVTALGAEHSSLSIKVGQAAKILGLGVEPDPEPKQARFTRSDQYSFVLAGIPSLHIKYGSATADGKNNLNDKVAIWRAKYYHKPQDDINGIFDFNAGVKYACLNFLIGYLVSQDPVRPKWNNGDVFEGR